MIPSKCCDHLNDGIDIFHPSMHIAALVSAGGKEHVLCCLSVLEIPSILVIDSIKSKSTAHYEPTMRPVISLSDIYRTFLLKNGHISDI